MPLSLVTSLNDKAAVVTAGTSQVGIAIAARLAEMGARVLLADTHDRHGYETVERLENQNLLVEFTHADVTKEADILHMLTVCQNAFTTVDILVNVSALNLSKPSHAATLEELEASFHGGLRSAFLGIRHASDIMKTQKNGGRIINVSLDANAHFSFHGLGQSAAMQLKNYNIAVNTVASASTKHPDEIAKAALFFATGLSQNATGQQIYLHD